MKTIEFEWDSGNWPKCGSHGVTREEIERLFLDDEVMISRDIKHSTPQEKRLIAVGHVKGRAMFVVFVNRNDRIRPLSARYMHKKELKHYEKESAQSA